MRRSRIFEKYWTFFADETSLEQSSIRMSIQTLNELRNAMKSVSADEKDLLYIEFIAEMERIDPKIEQAWVDEAKHRLRESEEGKVKMVPASEVLKEAARMIDERRRVSSSGES